MLNKYFAITLFIPLLFNFPLQPISLPSTPIAKIQEASVREELFREQTQVKIEAKELDQRAQILREYLAQYNSPLQNHAQDFIDAADTYDMDWKLVPAIAGVESTFGKHIPGGFNGWGWGVYGDQALGFESWRDGIFTVSEGLKKNYIDQGLKDPHSMNRKYAASPHWGGNVSFFLEDISQFEREYKASDEEYVLNHNDIEDKTAGSSAQINQTLDQLAFKI